MIKIKLLTTAKTEQKIALFCKIFYATPFKHIKAPFLTYLEAQKTARLLDIRSRAEYLNRFNNPF
jgi:hypothetical protein